MAEEIIVVKSDKNIYEFDRNGTATCVQKISFSKFKNRVFQITSSMYADDRSFGDRLYLKITLDGIFDLGKISVSATASYNNMAVEYVFSGTKYCCYMFSGEGIHFRKPVHFKLSFSHLDDPNSRSQVDLDRNLKSSTNTFLDDFKKVVKDSKKVTLVGSDGSVEIPKLLLQIRAASLKAMFAHDTKERRESRIVLKDFKVKTLKSYIHFLTTDELKNGKETALELYIFADKYDVPGLKNVARKYVLENVGQFGLDEVFDTFMMIDPAIPKKAFAKYYGK